MAESKETRAFCRALEAQGALTYPLVAGNMTPPGWPDRYVAHPLWSGFLEFKALNGKLSDLQKRIIVDLQDRFVHVWVVRFSEDWSKIRLEWADKTTHTDWIKWGEFFHHV